MKIDEMGPVRITSDSEVAVPTSTRLTGLQADWAGQDPAHRLHARAERDFPSHPTPARLPRPSRPGLWRIERASRERRPLAVALLLSLLIHALLLSLRFGGDEWGLPSLALPWRDRRIEVPDLRVVLVPAHLSPAKPAVISAAEPSNKVSIDPPRAGTRVLAPPVVTAPERQGIAAPDAVATKPPAQADATRSGVVAAASTEAPIRAQGPDGPLPVHPEPAAIDVKRSDVPSSVVRSERSPSVSVTSAPPSAPSTEDVDSASPDRGYAAQEGEREDAVRQEAALVEVARLEAERQEIVRRAAVQLEAQRQQTARQEAARVEAARLENERQENARQAAAELQAQRQEAARQEAARVEAARIAAERQETARQAAAELEAQRQQTVRQEAARVDAARLEAERQENARQAAAELEAQRQEAARQQTARLEAARLEVERQEAARRAAAELEAKREAARQEAARVQPARPEDARLAAAPPAVPRVEVEQDDAARREAALRAIGRQLDEEAARRQAVPPPNTLPYSLSTARRARLWGRTDPNVELVEYAEAWARKIQFNTLVETIRDVVRRPHRPSMVTVAVRSDGSVESVTFVVSSGVVQIDEAIRRIVESQRPFPAFPRALAREFDVIEIRRTWYFDSGVRLQ